MGMGLSLLCKEIEKQSPYNLAVGWMAGSRSPEAVSLVLLCACVRACVCMKSLTAFLVWAQSEDFWVSEDSGLESIIDH